MSLKTRLVKLETDNAGPAGVEECEVINDLPDPGERPGPRAVINTASNVTYAEPGETIPEFRTRCRTLAGGGGWVHYSMLDQ
jgi:hypothetical protein